MSCAVDGCHDRVHGRGLCLRHYVSARRARRRAQTCGMAGCDRPLYERDRCKAHYERWRRNAQPLTEPDCIRLRRAVGVPDDGPSPEQTARWIREEART